MQSEHISPVRTIAEVFGFTPQEAERYQVDHDRLDTIIDGSETTIHQALVEQRGYGEFLFITLSRHGKFVIFYGLGEHRYRQRWYANTWFWSPLQSILVGATQTLSKAEVKTIIHHRQQSIAKQVNAFRAAKEVALSKLLAQINDPASAPAQPSEILNLVDDLAGVS